MGIVTIATGFYVQQMNDYWIAIALLLLIGTAAGRIAVFALPAAGRRKLAPLPFDGRVEPQSRNLAEKIAGVLTVGVILCAGFVYGTFREHWLPSRDVFPLDAAVSMTGTVRSVRTVGSGKEVIVDVHHIGLISGLKQQNVAFAIEWILWRNVKEQTGTPPIRAEDEIQLRGLIQVPPSTSAKGIPVRKELAQMGIYYEFQGYSAEVKPSQDSWEGHTLSLISRALSASGISNDDSTLLQSIVFGHQNTAPSTQVHQMFLQSGLLHVLAASGANVFFIQWFFSLLLQPLVWVRRGFRFPLFVLHLLSVAFLWVFCALCGFQASIVRATLMATYGAVGKMAGRQISVWNSLLISGLAMTAVQPLVLLNPSSALSFTATAVVQRAVVSVTPRVRESVRRHFSIVYAKQVFHAFTSRVMAGLRVSLAVELYLIPLQLYWFQQLTPMSIAANVLAEPVIALLLPSTAALMAVSVLYFLIPWWVWSPFVHAMAWLDIGLLRILLLISQWLGNLPVSLYETKPMSVVDVLSYYIVLIGLPPLARRLWKLKNL